MAAAKNLRKVDVDGLKVGIDDQMVKSWAAFKIVSDLSPDLNAAGLRAMLDFVELVTDVDEAKIVKHCGGEKASLEDVAKTLAEIVSECYPKN